MRNIRLFWQIFPTCVGITIFSLVLAAWLATTTNQAFYIDHLKTDLRNRALLMEPTITSLSSGDMGQLQQFIRQTGRRAATRITLIDAEGLVLADSHENPALMDNHATRLEVAAALAGETGFSLRLSPTLGEPMLYTAIPIVLPHTDHRGALRMALPATAADKMLSALRMKMIGIGLAVVGLAGLLSLYSARKISRPLEEMKAGAEQLTKGRIDQLVKISSDRMSVEMAGLADSINQMAEQINRRIRIIIQQRNELEAVFSSMADSVVAIDADKKIIRMNQAATALFALPSEVVKGKPVQGIIRNAYLLEMIDFTLAQETEHEQKITLFNGTEPIILQTHAIPLRDEDNRSIGVLLVMNDLTKLNRLENIRQDFVANVSHELKTPITAIKGYVETLLDGALEDHDNARRFLDIIARQSNRLDAIVDDLLTLSRIEDANNKHTITLTMNRIAPVLENAVQVCAGHAEKKNIEVQIDCDEHLTAPINQPLLEQAIINLLENAIAYSSVDSRVSLRCCSSRTMQNEEFIHLSVLDNGPGIAKEHLPRLFERFYRCDKARGRDQGGTGLGLAIVKHIAQAHKGSVEVESTLGSGSTFTITLPMADR
ncbi:sensor histidine kinase [Desulfobulbus alkaliphilus]|uniref:sensor histidine kinase n=1 Tax=Desulfobulbus alkaliphilus TaxID=869814 RepID=UPI00196639B6|nr:ATP-binding protein [Desulfobulbus alkaliphilus]MBM9536664.1 PAS domain-containing protein [Desulfobulbus alkaliphilus]